MTILIEAGQIEQAFRLIDDIAPALVTTLEAVYLEAGLSAAEVLRSRLPTLLEFNALNDRAVFALQAERARIERGFIIQQRSAMLDFLMDAQRRGLAPIEQARAIRSSLGLSDYHARTVLNYRNLLETNSRNALDRQLRDRRFDPTLRRALREGNPLPPAQIDRMVERYSQRLKVFRAETIARSTSLAAVSAADEELWQQALDAGVVVADDMVSQWRTAGDSEVRSTHRPMNRQEQPFKQPFISGGGISLRFPGDPRAPRRETARCRCVVARTLKTR